MAGMSSANAGGVGLILGQGAKMPHASVPKNQNIKQKQCCNKLKTLKMIFIKTKQKNLKKKKNRKRLKKCINSMQHMDLYGILIQTS